MNKIVGVQFRKDGKIYQFDSGHFVLQKGTKVLVETEQGTALGVVCLEPRNLGEKCPEKPLKKISRLANDKDMEKYEKGFEIEREIYKYCYQRIKERHLSMSLVSVERLFDGSKVMIYFSADGRIDFRELVKDLVQKFHTRIEMRQIGVRHQAKMVGGLGNCGRQLCCTSFLTHFDPVSIKMAKEQNLSLNPAKISGMCGRLMCCLNYEYAYYEKAKKDIPKTGKKVNTRDGKGKVIRQNVLRKTLTVLLDSGEEKEISCQDVIKPRKE
ncbi:MAG: stage 0 sporulation family protein [Pseudomonadota bacterium]